MVPVPAIGWRPLVRAARACTLAAAMCLLSCTATHQVRTVGKGNRSVEVTLGGPMMTNLGAPIPMPNLFLGARYGLRDDMDIAASYNLTTPVIPGIPLDLIVSAHWIPVQPGLGRQAGQRSDRGWALGGALHVQWVSDFQHGLVVTPAIEIAGGYRYKWMNPFLGSGIGINFYRPHDSENPLQICPFAGVDLIARRHLSLSIKAVFYDIAYNYFGTQTRWVMLVDNPDNHKQYAPVGLALGLAWDWGKRK